MPFGTATVVTNKGKAIFPARIQTTAPAAGSVTPPAVGANPPKNVAIGTGATTAARTAVAADVALSQETESRVAGTESLVTTSQTGDTYQSVATITATAVRAVDEAVLADTASTTTAQSSAIATATSLVLVNSSIYQASGTLYALNRTTPSSGVQTITFSANNTGTNTLTVTALTGAITAGDWVVQGNAFVSATFPVVNLAIGDSIQLTFKTQLT